MQDDTDDGYGEPRPLPPSALSLFSPSLILPSSSSHPSSSPTLTPQLMHTVCILQIPHSLPPSLSLLSSFFPLSLPTLSVSNDFPETLLLHLCLDHRHG